MNRNLLVACSALLIAAPALVCFRYSQATAIFDEPAIIERLNRVPMAFGDWKSNAPDEEDVSAFHDEQYPGFMRQYENRILGRKVLLLLRGGPAGPLVYHHQPQQCYAALGFSTEGSPTNRILGANTFAISNYTNKESPKSESIRIYWAWSADGKWAVSGESRFLFRSDQVVFRLYVVERTNSPAEKLEGSASEDFLNYSLSDINTALFGK